MCKKATKGHGLSVEYFEKREQNNIVPVLVRLTLYYVIDLSNILLTKNEFHFKITLNDPLSLVKTVGLLLLTFSESSDF